MKGCGLPRPGAAKAASESCRSEVLWPVVACVNGMVAVAWARAVRTGWCGWERRDSALRLNGAVAAGRVRSCTGDEGGTPWLQYHGPCTLHMRTRLVQFRTSDSRAGAHGAARGTGGAGAGGAGPAARRGNSSVSLSFKHEPHGFHAPRLSAYFIIIFHRPAVTVYDVRFVCCSLGTAYASDFMHYGRRGRVS